jgi:hypothetical protein
MEGACPRSVKSYEVGNSTAGKIMTFFLYFRTPKFWGNTSASPQWSHISYELGLGEGDNLEKSLNLDFILLYMLFLLIALPNATKTFEKQLFTIFVDKVKNSHHWLVAEWLYFLEM